MNKLVTRDNLMRVKEEALGRSRPGFLVYSKRSGWIYSLRYDQPEGVTRYSPDRAWAENIPDIDDLLFPEPEGD